MRPRPALPGDVPAVLALEVAALGAEAWNEAQVREELLGERRRAFVVGDPVAGYVVTAVAGDVADLQRVAVAAARRREGLGRLLVEHAVAAVGAGGAERMLLEVAEGNAAARGLYAGLGFTEVARRPRYYRDGSACVVMGRPLRD